jgi:hypothetical protein
MKLKTGCCKRRFIALHNNSRLNQILYVRLRRSIIAGEAERNKDHTVIPYQFCFHELVARAPGLLFFSSSNTKTRSRPDVRSATI